MLMFTLPYLSNLVTKVPKSFIYTEKTDYGFLAVISQQK